MADNNTNWDSTPYFSTNRSEDFDDMERALAANADFDSLLSTWSTSPSISANHNGFGLGMSYNQGVDTIDPSLLAATPSDFSNDFGGDMNASLPFDVAYQGNTVFDSLLAPTQSIGDFSQLARLPDDFNTVFDLHDNFGVRSLHNSTSVTPSLSGIDVYASVEQQGGQSTTLGSDLSPGTTRVSVSDATAEAGEGAE